MSSLLPRVLEIAAGAADAVLRRYERGETAASTEESGVPDAAPR